MIPDTKGWWITPEAHCLKTDSHSIKWIKHSGASSRHNRIHHQKIRHQRCECLEKQTEHLENSGPLRQVFGAMFNSELVIKGKTVYAQLVCAVQQRGNAFQPVPEIAPFYQEPPSMPSLDSATETSLAGAGHPGRGDMSVALSRANFGVVYTSVEKAMDNGAIVIVPDIPDDHSDDKVATWENTSPKKYKWRVMDTEAEIPNEPVMTIRDLKRQRLLIIQDDGRPRARYRYFLFAVAQL
ncbi:hypothetical protein F4818DRAFT_452361 [Hypoxylon cercidicola]|nr:hypothetical protein F4818DRAFT_452361 [Hypoxylon cercidicola]